MRTTLRLDATRPLTDPASRIGVALDGSAQGLSGLPADLEGLFDKGVNWQGAAAVAPGAGAVEDLGMPAAAGAATAVSRRALSRERVVPYVCIAVAAGALTKTTPR